MAGSPDHLEPVKDFLTCPICFLEFEGRDPRSLMCLHGFCLSCLEAVHSTASKKNPNKADQIICPTCQIITPLPKKSLDVLPKYFLINQVRDMIDSIEKHTSGAQKRNSSDIKICDICGQAQATLFCIQCAELICAKCNVHDQKDQFEDHAVFDVTDKTDALICQEHDRLFESFCVECFTPVCKRCKLASHLGHELRQFHFDDTPETKKCDIDVDEKYLDERLQYIEDVKLKFNDHILSVHSDITECKNKLVSLIEEKYIRLLDTLCGYQEHMNSVLSDIKNDIETFKVSISRAKKNCANCIQPIPDIPKLGVKGVYELLEDIRCIPNKDFIIPDPAQYQFTADTREIYFGHIAKWTAHNAEAQIHSIDFFTEDTLITILKDQKQKPKVEFYNCQGNLVDPPFDISSITYPLGVAVHNLSSSVAVTHQHTYMWVASRHYVTFYVKDSTGSWKAATHLLLQYPQTACFSREGCLLVGTGSNCQILKYKTDGYLILKKKLAHSCDSITVDADSRLIVAGKSQVHVYSKTFDCLFTFPAHTELCHLNMHSFSSNVSQPLELNAVCLCTDTDNNILVADGNNNEVLVYSSRGHQLGHLVKLKGAPVCMALYEGKGHVVATKENGLFISMEMKL